METTGYGTSPSTPKAPGTLDSALSKASTGAHSAVNTMADAAGIHLPALAPLLHFSKRQDMVGWMIRRVEW